MRGSTLGGPAGVGVLVVAYGLCAASLHARSPATVFSFASSPAPVLDADGDGLADAWEIRHGLDPRHADNAALDIDGDGLDASAECAVGSDPWNADTPPEAGRGVYATDTFAHPSMLALWLFLPTRGGAW